MIEWVEPEKTVWTIRIILNQSGSGRISFNIDFYKHLNVKQVRIGYNTETKRIIIKKAEPGDEKAFSIYHRASIASINSRSLGDWIKAYDIKEGLYKVEYNEKEDQYETIHIIED